MRQPAVYIMANKRNGTIYVGVTSDLIIPIPIFNCNIVARRSPIIIGFDSLRLVTFNLENAIKRIYELIKGFTKKYGCKLLVFYELHKTMISAISREKLIKGGSRKKKLDLIEAINQNWKDLYADVI